MDKNEQEKSRNDVDNACVRTPKLFYKKLPADLKNELTLAVWKEILIFNRDGGTDWFTGYLPCKYYKTDN